MKLLNPQQIKALDRATMELQQISSVELMERAATKCAKWLAHHARNSERFYILCGPGNNGGDGLAIARLLYQKGFDVKVFINESTPKFSPDARINYDRLKEISGIPVLDFDEVYNNDFKGYTTVVDALFGIGLTRKPDDPYESVINFINRQRCRKIAIDVPSGISADELPGSDCTAFHADVTLTFHCYKRSFLHPETGRFCGRVEVLDIGLAQDFSETLPAKEFVTDDFLIQQIYKPRSKFAHKGTYGRSLIVAGSYGKIGAAVLAVNAALRSGSGLTTCLAPKCSFEILQAKCPEAMFIAGGENYIHSLEIDADFSIGIGPGLDTRSETEQCFLEFLKQHQKPLVIDADALNIIAKHPENLQDIPKNSILTPHPKEFLRLFGVTNNSVGQLNLAIQKSKQFGVFIVLKGHHTQVITPEGDVYYNITGNAGMAKGGSGDALLGIITSLLAQGYSSKEAAIFGVWLHGKAGNIAAEKYSQEAMLPTDLINSIGDVFKYLQPLSWV